MNVYSRAKYPLIYGLAAYRLQKLQGCKGTNPWLVV